MAFRFLTSGESHGRVLNALIEGVPAGFEINIDNIDNLLYRRQLGYGRGGRMKIEQDKITINSGIRHGVTTGAPICLEIPNKDWRNWEIPMSTLPVDLNNPAVLSLVDEKKITNVRPGHADLAGALKYNHKDVRNVLERSSARETAMRVAVGGVASAILRSFGIEVFSHVVRIGDASVSNKGLPESYKTIKNIAETSDVRCADTQAASKMRDAIDGACDAGDSIGGTFEIVALNVPVGLGSYVHWDRRIDGQLAQAIMSIPAIKSVGIGLGRVSSEIPGSKLHDEIFPKNEGDKTYNRKTNNSGGIEGGITNGSPVVVRAAMKPIPTLKKPLRSIDLETGQEHIAHYERSDVCAVPAAGVVGEAMVSIILVKAFLEKFGGDSFAEITANYNNFLNMYQKR